MSTFRQPMRLLAAVLALCAGVAVARADIKEPPSPSNPPAKENEAKRSETATADKRPAAAPGHILVTGQITDPIGAGLRDVTVTVFRKNSDGSRGEMVVEAATDIMGDFAVVSPDPIKGEVIIVFSKPQFAEMLREVRLGESDKPPFLGETMNGNLSLEGRVLNAAGQKPIVGAKVVFQSVALEREAKTDDEGKFQIGGLSPGGAELVVTGAGFGRERQAIRVPVAEETLIRLKPERSVHLSVVDDLGKPIRGAAIEILDAPRSDIRTLVTGDEGSVDITGLHFDASSLLLRLSHEGHVSTRGAGERLTMPLLESESRHRLVMERAGTITGRVTEARSGEAAHGARLIAGDEYADDLPRAWTDESGKFTLTGVKPGTATVTVHHAGHAPQLGTVEVKAEESATLNLRLSEPATVRGMVRNQTGEPIAGAEIAVSHWHGHDTLGLRAMTDRDGRFVIEDAPRDEFEISVSAAGASPFIQKVNGGVDKLLEITLRAGHPAQTAGAQTHLKAGDAVPTVNLKTLDGRNVTLAGLKGKTVLVVFWATWCSACMGEFPNLIAVHEKFRGRKDFLMLGISRDYEEKALSDYLKGHPQASWPEAFGESGGVPQVVEAFGVWSIPAIFLIGPDGKIAAAELRGEETMKAIEGVLKDRQPE